MEPKGIMAIYDIRGIQKYIFKTDKVKDAIGASSIVSSIISDALKYAVEKEHLGEVSQLDWYCDEGPIKYMYNENKIQVLYIGGGNAVLFYESLALYQTMNKHMAKFILNNTYSLQLVAAYVEITGDYKKDHVILMNRLNENKADMVISKPLGALPGMAVELKTGYPAVDTSSEADDYGPISTESKLKKSMERQVRKNDDREVKILDNYVTKKGVDSTIAIVHIDGNNMGLRIRELMEGIHDYEEAINKMRNISWHISNSYTAAFNDMMEHFNAESKNKEELKEKETDNFVLKILTAGDDITYVSNGKIALETVDYFEKQITKYSMTGETDPESLKRYGFSFCAGISFINSHFPFYVGYDVAEACCESAKDCAKDKKYMDNGRVRSWVDFQICRNIQASNLKSMREHEYVTSHGEQLLKRPYCMLNELDTADAVKELGPRSVEELENNIKFFQAKTREENGGNIPRSFAKQLRNVYPLGEDRTIQFMSFLKSRNWALPDKSYDAYEDSENNEKIAKWYDALEMMDYFA